MKETDIPVIQASLDQIQRQLTALYAEMLYGSIPDEEERKKMKMEASATWNKAYQEAKEGARTRGA